MITIFACLALLGVPPLQLPPPSGPLPIGTRIEHWVDLKRPDPVHPSLHRESMVQLWYPAAEAKGPLAPYIPDSHLMDVLVSTNYYGQDKSTLDPWRTLETHAYLNAQVSRTRRWPVVLFSHGLGVARSNYTTCCEDLASHGFFVAAIDHPYGGETCLPDGRHLSANDDPGNADMSHFADKEREWALDACFVLDSLGRAPTLRSAFDFGKVAMIGHSSGGAAAWEAAVIDKRIRAAIDLDGVLTQAAATANTKTPFLRLLSSPNYSDADLAKLGRTRAQWNQMKKGPPGGPKPPAINGNAPGPLYSVTILNTLHMSFSDAPFVMPNTVTRFSDHAVPAPRMLEVTMGIVRSFLDRFLLGRKAPMWADRKSPWPEATVVRER